MPCQPLTIILSEIDQQDLEKLALRPSTPQQIPQRARIVLEAALGKNNAEIARTLDISVTKKYAGNVSQNLDIDFARFKINAS